MKKVMFLQLKGKSYGGVWQVNKLVGEELIKNGYNVSIISLRNNNNALIMEYDPKLIVKTINENDKWGTYSGTEIKKEIKKNCFIKAFNMLVSRITYNLKLKKDIQKLQNYIRKEKPNYIITSHYQLLDMVPKEYLKVTINEQHSSFDDACHHKATIKTLYCYKDKVKFVWLTKKTMEKAIDYGLLNSTYIYNAVRFKSKEASDVIKNKKLITICRLSEEKRIDLMINMVEEIFKDNLFKDWHLEIYGNGDEEDKLAKIITNKKQIKLMGLTSDPKKELLKSSINLNTSKYEGFSLSILEANECGVPTIAFDFGESTQEEIVNNQTGIIAKDRENYINNLKELMINENKLITLSNNCKTFSNNFQIEKIVQDWINLFNQMDNLHKEGD